jgi:hypothetical protein
MLCYVGDRESVICISSIICPARRVWKNGKMQLRNSHKLPHYIVFIADPSLVEDEAVMKYLLAPF